MNLYSLIQNYIVDQINLFVAGTGFLEVTYGVDGKAVLGAKVTPTLVRVNELAGTFEESDHYRRERIFERDTWTWQLLMCFPRKVELENFKNEVVTSGLKVDRSDTNPPVFLNFTSFFASHNVEEQGSADGTELVWTINAQVERLR